MKALAVRLSSIGDVVHTLPALAALRRQGWAVVWPVEPAARPLLETNPEVARTVPLPAARAFRLGEAAAALRALRAERCDVALDFQGLWKSAFWARASAARRVLGRGRGPGGARRESLSGILLDEVVPPPPEAVHVIDENLSLLRPLGIDAIGTREFPLPATTLGPAMSAALEAIGPAFAIVNPGGGWASKLWPPERHAALTRALRRRGLVPLVSWGPGEQPLADVVVAASEGAAVRCPTTSLLEYVELARRARLVVAADTGPLHLACAVGTPVVALFGPTDPARNGPFSAEDVVVRRVPACAPCHRRRCERHRGVMAEITVEEVTAAVDRRLANVRGPAVRAR